MSDLYISWDEYHKNIERLAIQVHQSAWPFDQIVCLARGGLRIGDVLSRLFQRPLAILVVSSYDGPNNSVRGNLRFARHLTTIDEQFGRRVLLVDDLVDSGITLKETAIWLRQHYGQVVEEIRTAVIWYKACSAIAPDYYVDYLPENPWIHQPFERYERMEPDDLIATPFSQTPV